MCFLGFSADQYNFDDSTKGNRVYFTRDTTTLECQVLTYYSSTTQIVCDTRYIAMHLITLSVTQCEVLAFCYIIIIMLSYHTGIALQTFNRI